MFLLELILYVLYQGYLNTKRNGWCLIPKAQIKVGSLITGKCFYCLVCIPDLRMKWAQIDTTFI